MLMVDDKAVIDGLELARVKWKETRAEIDELRADLDSVLRELSALEATQRDISNSLDTTVRGIHSARTALCQLAPPITPPTPQPPTIPWPTPSLVFGKAWSDSTKEVNSASVGLSFTATDATLGPYSLGFSNPVTQLMMPAYPATPKDSFSLDFTEDAFNSKGGSRGGSGHGSANGTEESGESSGSEMSFKKFPTVSVNSPSGAVLDLFRLPIDNKVPYNSSKSASNRTKPRAPLATSPLTIDDVWDTADVTFLQKQANNN
ncbi:hypothetical protein Pelo_17054 [Pelomyxa schiedti]|nr:hypothetical protein Pelo_17054 [Pelomyxa schiedti]